MRRAVEGVTALLKLEGQRYRRAIIGQKQIWVTHTQYLNDCREFLHGGWRALVRYPAYRDLAVTGGRQTAERPWELNIQIRMPEMS